MNKTSFNGRIYSGDFELVQQTLQQWISAPLIEKRKLSGEQLTYEDDRLEIYCHRAYGTTPGQDEFLLEGKTSAGLDVTKNQLEILKQRLQTLGVDCDLEYVEVNEDGDYLGEQFQIG